MCEGSWCRRVRRTRYSKFYALSRICRQLFVVCVCVCWAYIDVYDQPVLRKQLSAETGHAFIPGSFCGCLLWLVIPPLLVVGWSFLPPVVVGPPCLLPTERSAFPSQRVVNFVTLRCRFLRCAFLNFRSALKGLRFNAPAGDQC